MESLELLTLRETVDRVKKASLFQRADIAVEAVEQAVGIVASHEFKLKELEKRINNIQGL